MKEEYFFFKSHLVIFYLDLFTIYDQINQETFSVFLIFFNKIEIEKYDAITFKKKTFLFQMTSVSSYYYVSQFTVETYCFADGRCLFKQSQSVTYHWNQYDEEISDKCRSVRLSVRPSVSLSVCNATKKKPTPPSLLTVEK